MTSSLQSDRKKSARTSQGMFGGYGGRFVPEVLWGPLRKLELAYAAVRKDKSFWAQLDDELVNYVGRPSPLYFAERLTKFTGGAQIYFKRDELNHTGSHKINNVVGQSLLALRMGCSEIVAETGAGQHGVAVATLCAKRGMHAKIFMGALDIQRQAANVAKMKLLGAEIVPVTAGSGTLKDALNEAMRYWVSNNRSCYFLIGSAAGPHPYPTLVRDFQSVIGRELRQQMLDRTGRLPTALCAAVGGGSNALGMFHPFLADKNVSLIAVEAGGPANTARATAAAISHGLPGHLHGYRSYFLQDDNGCVEPSVSIAAGLDYPGIGPELAHLYDCGRVEVSVAYDHEAVEAFKLCVRSEGIIPALEPSHALVWAIQEAPRRARDDIVVVNLCGHGGKDTDQLMRLIDAQPA